MFALLVPLVLSRLLQEHLPFPFLLEDLLLPFLPLPLLLLIKKSKRIWDRRIGDGSMVKQTLILHKYTGYDLRLVLFDTRRRAREDVCALV